MSSEKKNKERDPVALLNDSPTSRLVQKFLEMPETDYARNVVIPSLEAEGYERIDFHHGPTEVGKDLIFSKTMGYGRKLLVVAVIKSDRLSKSSSDASGFPVIRIQLQQALDNEVTSWDGTKRRPDRVIVIFADDPSSDIISSNPGGFQDCTARGVEFISGSEIACSLLHHRKDIAEQILETKLDATAFFNSHPTNLPLLHALHNNELVDIQTIFTDLDAAVGSTTIAKVLSLRLSAKSKFVLVAEDVWSDVSKTIREMEAVFGNFLLESLDDAENKFRPINKRANSKANKNRLTAIEKVAGDIQRWASAVRQEIDQYSVALSTELRKHAQLNSIDNKLISDVNDVLIKVKDDIVCLENVAIKIQSKRNIKGDVKQVSLELIQCFNSIEAAKSRLIEIQQEKLIGLRKSISEILGKLVKSLYLESRNAKDFVDNSGKTLKYGEMFVVATPYELQVDINKLDRQIKRHLKALILRFQSDQVAVNRDYSRQLLEDVHRYLSVLDLFLANTILSSVLVPSTQQNADITGLSACILGLLNSGVDVLIIGNAGSGKSTTLEMFARRRFECRKKNEEVIFLPLVKLATSIASAPRDPLVIFCDEIARLFCSAQPGVTSKFVMDRIATASHLVLIFDGIDEASELIGWLLQLIIAIRKLKSGAVQIVASSRFGVPELEKSGLIQIQLLPFRPEQVERFVRDFLCNEPTLSEEVIEYLNRHPTMFSVAQTPMMSTILCVLAKNGVILPETKNALYKERFELLWGAYDAKKQVLRVQSSRSCLEDVSKKVAYYLHVNRIRSAVREKILSYVQDALTRRYRTEFIVNAMKELERPCNVLVEDIDGKVGFGHLSYQEYLVSEELYSNRHGDIVAHLADPWWRGVLVLTAMKTEDIGSIIEDRVMQMGVIGNAAETLNAMIEVCDANQRRVLSNLLRGQTRLDFMADDESF
jgi:hypothetical protein